MEEIIDELFLLIEQLSYAGCLLEEEEHKADELYERYMKIKYPS